jgi:hypothetical protein
MYLKKKIGIFQSSIYSIQEARNKGKIAHGIIDCQRKALYNIAEPW